MKIKLVVLVIFVLFGAQAVFAQGEPAPPLPPDTEISGSVFLLESVSGDMHPNALAPNPIGCYGQTDAPHNSSHVTGTINVVARTVCPGINVTTIHVDTILYRFNGATYVAVGPFSPNTASGASSVSTNSATTGECVPGTYQGASNHYVIYLGNVYRGSTYNVAARTIVSSMFS